MKTPLTLANLASIVGKTIKWEAEANKHNKGYHGYGIYGGITRITAIDHNNYRPIIAADKVDHDSEDIIWAFVDDHSLVSVEGGFVYKKATENNNCLSYSDSDREIFFDILDEN